MLHTEAAMGSGTVLPVGSFARYFAFTVPDGHDLLQIITDYARNNKLPAAYVVRCGLLADPPPTPGNSAAGIPFCLCHALFTCTANGGDGLAAPLPHKSTGVPST